MAALFPRWGAPPVFPALASLGAAIGLDFLQKYEGLFISKLLPLFAVVALLANALGWLSYRHWHRSSLLGMIGPAIVFAGAVWLLGNWWTANLVYVGLAFMVGGSIWDFVSPANRAAAWTAANCPPARITVEAVANMNQ